MKYAATFLHKTLMLIWWGFNLAIRVAAWALGQVFMLLWHMDTKHFFPLIGDFQDNLYYEIDGEYSWVATESGEWKQKKSRDYYYRNPKDLFLSIKTYK